VKFTRNRQHSAYVEPPPKRDDIDLEVVDTELDKLRAAIVEMERWQGMEAEIRDKFPEFANAVMAALAHHSATTRTQP
jgi:hypothetical protein